jgi:hypothetical protein
MHTKVDGSTSCDETLHHLLGPALHRAIDLCRLLNHRRDDDLPGPRELKTILYRPHFVCLKVAEILEPTGKPVQFGIKANGLDILLGGDSHARVMIPRVVHACELSRATGMVHHVSPDGGISPWDETTTSSDTLASAASA